MAELVRLALNKTSEGINWPKRCPQCGEEGPLVKIEGRVYRESGSYYVYAVAFRWQATRFNIPMCSKHASRNELGMRLLERSFLLSVLRALAYLSLIFLFSFVAFGLVKRVTLAKFALFFHVGSTSMMFFLFYGILSLIVILWARRAASVCPVKIDDNDDIITIRFSNKEYASDFKRANYRATCRINTKKPILFSFLWKTTLSVFVLFLVFKWFS